VDTEGGHDGWPGDDATPSDARDSTANETGPSCSDAIVDFRFEEMSDTTKITDCTGSHTGVLLGGTEN
jgi:hypothetical protein